MYIELYIVLIYYFYVRVYEYIEKYIHVYSLIGSKFNIVGICIMKYINMGYEVIWY